MQYFLFVNKQKRYKQFEFIYLILNKDIKMLISALK